MTINAMILAGGLATRLGEASKDTPKALVEVNKKPFMLYHFDQLLKAGVRRVVICTGHLSEMFPKIIGHQYKDLEIIYSTEPRALGTGGAISHAKNLILSDECLVMNGDSYINTHLDKFISWHGKNDFLGSILITSSKMENRYGNIKINNIGGIKSFSEKGETKGKSYISTGHYIFNRDLINDIPMNKFVSLEHDCFPLWTHNRLGGFYRRAKFIDIGTPESLNEAQTFFKNKKKKEKK